MEDLGLVRAAREGERKVYHLTDAGHAELDTRAEEVAAFWGRFAAPATTPSGAAEMGFLRDEWNELTWTVWGGLRGSQPSGDPAAMVRAVRRALERCKNEVRSLLAAGGGSAPETEVV